MSKCKYGKYCTYHERKAEGEADHHFLGTHIAHNVTPAQCWGEGGRGDFLTSTILDLSITLKTIKKEKRSKKVRNEGEK